MAHVGRQLDSHPEHQFFRDTDDIERDNSLGREICTYCMANHPYVVGRDAAPCACEHSWLKIPQLHQQVGSVVDRHGGARHFDCDLGNG